MAVQKRRMESDISEEAMKERHYLWMARTFALVAVVSAMATVILVVALTSLLPVLRVQPFYLSTLNKNQQIINVTRPNYGQLDMIKLTESFVRQYLTARLSIGSNIAELERRWGLDGIVNWMSSETVFQEFATLANSILAQVKKEGLTRSVKILVVSPFRQQQGASVWRAEVEFTDMRTGDSAPQRSKWIVTMEVGFRPNRPGLKWEQRLNNPLGFTVTKFGIERVNS